MRVLLSCLQSRKRHPIPAYSFWREYFVKGCEEAGIECVEVPGVDWAEGLLHSDRSAHDAWRRGAWEAVLNFARQERERRPIDFFLGYLYPRQVDASAVGELRRSGVPCVNFFCDNVREFDRVPAEYAAFDLHWVPEFEALPLYERAGLAYVHAPMPCWVAPELRAAVDSETEPATFLGSPDPLRRHLLGEALRLGADFVVRGRGWEESQPAAAPRRSLGSVLTNQADLVRRSGWRALGVKVQDRVLPLPQPPLPPGRLLPAAGDCDYLRITREAAVAIGVNRVPTALRTSWSPLRYSRLRDIEAPMVGACYLTEKTDGLARLYELGREVEAYSSPSELTEKLSALLADPARRRRMRLAAQRRALEEHSVARTLRRLADRLGLRL